MEIIKKNKNKKLHSTKNYWGNPIITQFILTQRICDQNKILPEITKQIKYYNIAAKDNAFKSYSKIFIEQWDNFYIPTIYYYHLTSKQMSLMEKLLTSDTYYDSKEHEFYHCLESKKDYKLFLTLPERIRLQLSLLPQSEIIIQTELIQPETLDLRINKGQTILIKRNLREKIKSVAGNDPTVGGIQWNYYKEKPMLTKNKKKNHKK